MKVKAFQRWLSGLRKLSRGQREAVKQDLHRAGKCDDVVMQLEQGMEKTCPRCASNHLYRWGRSAGLQRFRCRDCGKTFNVLSGTALARLRHKENWLTYSQAVIEGASVREAAARCDIDKTTSFRWRHRFLRAPANQKAKQLHGIAEADETFFRESFKGHRQLGRKAHKRGQPARQRGTGTEKIPVVVLRDRHGETADFRLAGTSTAHIEPVLQSMIPADTILCSDGAASYRIASQRLGIVHRPVNLSAGIRVVDGVYHIQNVNAYTSRLKEWMRRFHGVATKYLEGYLGWRRWLERSGRHQSPTRYLWAAMGREPQFNT
jgi:transposase-like protein